jgi:hypothetical protein
MPGGEHYRTHERRPVRLGATVRQRDGEWAASALVVDLSLGGACVELRERVQTGLAVVIEIVAPTLWDPLVMRGTVAWVKPAAGRMPSRAGVRFVVDDPPQLFALFEVLAAHAYE